MNLLKAIGFFFAALVFVLSAVLLSSWLNQSKNPITPARPVVSCAPDRLSYIAAANQNPNQIVKLISERKQMFADSGQFVNSQIVVAKNETSDSKVACGYLFLKAGTKNHGALQDWENAYINASNFGGHIISKSAFSVNDGRDFSEYIFSLDKIQYKRDRNSQTILTADWASLLNVSPEVSFRIALNTNDRSGFIDELSIAYKCWDPTTGIENTGCKLSVRSSQDTQTSQPLP